jgi:hypothetical protein
MRRKLFLVAIAVTAILTSAAPVFAKGGVVWGNYKPSHKP